MLRPVYSQLIIFCSLKVLIRSIKLILSEQGEELSELFKITLEERRLLYCTTVAIAISQFLICF
jgi:hypothetical protein